MTERSSWSDLRERRMAEPGAREGYEAEKRAYELGEAVRQLRTELGLTQRQLGKRARLTQSAVARLEAGDVVPTLRVLERIAEALGTHLDVSLRKPQVSASKTTPVKPAHC
jgi:transcriptional regulator with XRE-family HTH domain